MPPTKAPQALDAVLRPIGRKTSVRAMARLEGQGDPVLCRVDLLRAAKAQVGLSNEELADLCGTTQPTIRKALAADPSTKIGLFCRMVQVLGLSMAEIFPVPQKQVVNGTAVVDPYKWSPGPYLKENAAARISNKRKRS